MTYKYFLDLDPEDGLIDSSLLTKFRKTRITEDSKTKTYSVTIFTERNKERLALQQTEYFNNRLKIRYRIEEKNGELKQAHGLRTADSTGLDAMRLQTYFTAFTVNIKRFVKLMEKKAA